MTSASVQESASPNNGTTIDETIRATVRGLRGARQVEVPELAAVVGISKGSFYNRLKGTAPFLAAEIALLAAFFGVPITDFYEGIVRVGRTTPEPPDGGFNLHTVPGRYPFLSSVEGVSLRVVGHAATDLPRLAAA